MSEHDEQVRVVQWCDLMGVPVFAIPNGGFRPKATAARLRDEGVRAGVPDLFVPLARHNRHGLFIEMKDVDGRHPRGAQMEWLDLLNGNGYVACWSRGADAAIDMIRRYIDD